MAAGGLKTVKGRTLYRIMSFCCSMAFMMYGYDAGVLGGVQTTKPFLDSIGNPTGTYVIPMISSSYTLAAAVCSLAVMIIGMPLGRRNCILLGDLFVIVGASIQATSYSVAQIIVARLLCGIGIGFISCSVPTYMAEMSIESKERGPEVAVQCIYLISGVALAYWIDFGVAQSQLQLWRFPIAFQGAFAIVSGAGMLFLPDTPRWYYAKGRTEEGDDVLHRLWDLPLDHHNVQNMRNEILASIKLEAEEENKFNILDLVWDRSDLKAGRRIRISFLILSIQQMMGESLESGNVDRIADLCYGHQSLRILQYSHLSTGRAFGLLGSAPSSCYGNWFCTRHLSLAMDYRARWSTERFDLVCCHPYGLHDRLRGYDWFAKPDQSNAMGGCGGYHRVQLRIRLRLDWSSMALWT